MRCVNALFRYDRGGWPRRMASSRSRSVRRAAGQHHRARTRGRQALPKKESAPALGHNRGGFSAQIHSLADRQGRPLPVPARDGRPDRTQAWARVAAWDRRAAVRPARGPGL